VSGRCKHESRRRAGGSRAGGIRTNGATRGRGPRMAPAWSKDSPTRRISRRSRSWQRSSARPPAGHQQSARRRGGGRTTKGIVGVDNRPCVNAATRVTEVALLDHGCRGSPRVDSGVTASVRATSRCSVSAPSNDRTDPSTRGSVRACGDLQGPPRYSSPHLLSGRRVRPAAMSVFRARHTRVRPDPRAGRGDRRGSVGLAASGSSLVSAARMLCGFGVKGR
jgi:hypothetical protein